MGSEFPRFSRTLTGPDAKNSPAPFPKPSLRFESLLRSFSCFSANTKFSAPEFTHGGFQQYLQSFVQNGAVSFYQPILNDLILPHAVFFGYFGGGARAVHRSVPAPGDLGTPGFGTRCAPHGEPHACHLVGAQAPEYRSGATLARSSIICRFYSCSLSSSWPTPGRSGGWMDARADKLMVGLPGNRGKP